MVGANRRRFRGEGRGYASVTIAAVLPVIRKLDLMAGRRLPRPAVRGLPLVEVVDSWTCLVRAVQEWIAVAQIADELTVLHQKRRAGGRRVVAIDHGAFATPRPLCGEEPQLVLHERSAERSVDVPHFLDDWQASLRDATSDEIVGEVRPTLHTRTGVIPDERGVKGVPSGPGDVVDVHTIGGRLAKPVAEFDGHLVGRCGIRDEHASAPVVGLESVDKGLVVTISCAVDAELDVGFALAAAHVLTR